MGRYYPSKRKLYAEDFPDFYDADLRAIFGNGEPGGESAVRVMRRYRAALIESIVQWTGQRKYTVSMLVRKLILRCQELKLPAPQNHTRLHFELLGISCGTRDQPPVHREVQEVSLSMKILVLFDVARPADPNETFSARSLKEEDKPTEADVLRCLKRLGHDVETLAVFDNVTDIVEKLKAYAPDIVFNLSESFYQDRSHEPNIPALLELMKVRYTGIGARSAAALQRQGAGQEGTGLPPCALAAFRSLTSGTSAPPPETLHISGVRQARERGVV